MSIASFSALKDHVRTLPPAGLAVAGGNDPDVVRAVIAALEAGMIDRAIMSGDPALMAPMVPAKWLDHVRLVKGGDATECARHAVSAVRVGEADILMKGHVDSTSYLRAVVDGETGIRGDGVLSNITVASMPSYPKLLVVTDNGIVPIPTLEQKRQIILNTRPFFSGMGISPIRVAAIAATEKVSDRLPATIDANALAEESRANGLRHLRRDLVAGIRVRGGLLVHSAGHAVGHNFRNRPEGVRALFHGSLPIKITATRTGGHESTSLI